MKAITLHQPWASLLAVGPKKYETRSWKTKHRGWIAIHAAKRFDRLVMDACAKFNEELDEVGYRVGYVRPPLGAVVGVGKLFAICSTEYATSPSMLRKFGKALPYGDYSAGRFVWVFSDMIPLDHPIPAIGRQGIWNWEYEIEDILSTIPLDHLQIMKGR